MATAPSLITTALTVDPALQQVAPYRFGPEDRQYIDNQVRGCEQHLADLVINGVEGTWLHLDPSSAAVVTGDVVALASSATTTPTVTRAVAAVLAVSHTAAGIVLVGAAPGARVKVATGGIIPASITGLAASDGFVKVNTTTARCEHTAGLVGGDFPLGSVDASGNMSLRIFGELIPFGGAVESVTAAAGSPITVTAGTTPEVDILAASGANRGSFSAGGFTKLAGIEALADVTDDANVRAALAAATATIDVNEQRITNLGAPTDDTDAVRLVDIAADYGSAYEVRIALVGDSTCEGPEPAPGPATGPREDMYRLMRSRCRNWRWIGTSDGLYDGRSELGFAEFSGGSGQRIEAQEAHTGVYAAADRIVLWIGLNNVVVAGESALTMLDRLRSLFDVIDANAPDGFRVFIGTIPRLRSAVVGYVAFNVVIDAYNTGLTTVCAERGSHYQVVSCGHDLTDDEMNLTDGLHPNIAGFRRGYAARMGGAILRSFAPYGGSLPLPIARRPGVAAVALTRADIENVVFPSAALRAPTSLNVTVQIEVFPLGLLPGPNVIYQYAVAAADGMTITQAGADIAFLWKGSTVASAVGVLVPWVWQVITVVRDGTNLKARIYVSRAGLEKQNSGLGHLVASETIGSAPLITVAEATTVGFTGASPGMNARYANLFVCNATANNVSNVEGYYSLGESLSGVTEHIPFDEGTGTSIGSDLGGSAGTLTSGQGAAQYHYPPGSSTVEVMRPPYAEPLAYAKGAIETKAALGSAGGFTFTMTGHRRETLMLRRNANGSSDDYWEVQGARSLASDVTAYEYNAAQPVLYAPSALGGAGALIFNGASSLAGFSGVSATNQDVGWDRLGIRASAECTIYIACRVLASLNSNPGTPQKDGVLLSHPDGAIWVGFRYNSVVVGFRTNAGTFPEVVAPCEVGVPLVITARLKSNELRIKVNDDAEIGPIAVSLLHTTLGTAYCQIGRGSDSTEYARVEVGALLVSAVEDNGTIRGNIQTQLREIFGRDPRKVFDVQTVKFPAAAGPITITQADLTTNGATGAAMTDVAQTATGTTSTGGARTVKAGGGTAIGGEAVFSAGDGSGNGGGGHALVKGGDAAGSGADGNVALHDRPSTWATGERIGFIGKATAGPSDNTDDGSFVWADPSSGVVRFRSPGGVLTTIGFVEVAVALIGGTRTIASGYDLTYAKIAGAPRLTALNASPALGAQIMAAISGNDLVLTSYSVLGAAAVTDVATYTVSLTGAI